MQAIAEREEVKALGPYQHFLIALDLRDIQTFDGWKRSPDEALKVAIEAGEVADGAEDLLLTLGPESLCRTFLGIEVDLHGDQGFDDASYSLLELRASEVVVD
jgi:hypothetical protein